MKIDVRDGSESHKRSSKKLIYDGLIIITGSVILLSVLLLIGFAIKGKPAAKTASQQTSNVQKEALKQQQAQGAQPQGVSESGTTSAQSNQRAAAPPLTNSNLKTICTTNPIPYETVYANDPDRMASLPAVESGGINGSKELCVKPDFSTTERVITLPIKKVITKGTKYPTNPVVPQTGSLPFGATSLEQLRQLCLRITDSQHDIYCAPYGF